MFTGLIQHVGKVRSLAAERDGSSRLEVDIGPLSRQANPGDSIAVDGCCLTVVNLHADIAAFDAVPETLRRTTLNEVRPGSCVNLESSLLLGSRLGGHFVQGHVDGIAIVSHVTHAVRSGEWHFHIENQSLIGQVVEKGSIAIDGISLTVAGCDPAAGTFWVALIPETLARTSLGSKKKGDRVNIETDILAKYVRAALHGSGHAHGATGIMNEERLRELGY